MARPKKTNIEMKNLIEEYWINVCDRDTKKLKYTMIANYFKGKGVEVEAYDLRRNPEAVEYIEHLKQGELIALQPSETTIIFQALDVNDFLEKNNNIYKLRKALAEKDIYYANICYEAVICLQQKESLEKMLKKLKKEKQDIEQSVTRLQTAEECLREENKMQKAKCNNMMKILKTYVYPEIANELLRENKFLEGGETIISDSGKKEFLEDQSSLLAYIRKQDKVDAKSTILTDLFNKI